MYKRTANPGSADVLVRREVSTIRVSGWDKDSSNALIPPAYAGGTDRAHCGRRRPRSQHLVALIFLIAVTSVAAQHTGHSMATPTPTPKAFPSPTPRMESMPG